MNLYVFSSSRALYSFLLQKSEGFLPKAITMGELFSQIIFVKGKTKARALTQKILLAQVLKHLELNDSQKQHLFFEYNFVGFLETSSFLFDFFRELFASQVSLQEVICQDVYGDFEDHLGVIERIYQAYESKLCENGLYDFSNEYEIFWDFLKGFIKIEFFIDGFLSAFEWKVLHQIASCVPSVLHCSIDSFNLSHFKDLNSTLCPNYRYTLSLPQGEILHSSPFELQSQFTLTSCEFRSDQCAVVIAKVNQWLQEGVLAENIAVVIPSEDFLPFLEVSDEARNFNFAMGKTSLVFQEQLEKLKLQKSDEIVPFEVFCHHIDLMIQALPYSLRAKLVDVLFDFEQNQTFLLSMSLKELIELFIQEVEGLREEDTHGGKVKVIGVLETRGMQFEKVIVVDFVQENIPVFSQNDMFLNTAVRQRLKMPTMQDKQNLQKHFYFELFKNSKEVQIVFARPQPSLFVQELAITQEICKNPYTLFPKNQERHYQDDVIAASLSQDFSLSSASLNLYKTCKRKFYFHYLCTLREESESQEELMGLGRLIHQTLEEAYQGFNDLVQARARFERRLREKKSQQNIKMQMQLSLALLEMQNFWEQEFANPPNKILYLEHSFAFKYKGWEFKGRIDRIDEKDGLIRVIDYKFSKSVNFDPIQGVIYYLYLKTLFPTQDIEVCFYALKNGEMARKVDLTQDIEELNALLLDLQIQQDFAKTDSFATCRDCVYQLLCNR